MTLNELAYDLLLIARGGSVVNTESISLDQIKFWIINTRAQFIRNELNKARTIDPSLIQDLGCIELEDVDASLCCGVDLDCKVLRTKIKIPSFIELHTKPLITRVGPIDRSRPAFDVISLERLPFEFTNKFTKNLIRAYILEGYVYLAFDSNNFKARLIDTINIQGVFEDPRQLAPFICNGSTPCYTDDSEFPMKHWMVESMKEQIKKVNLFPTAQAPIDNTADGNHNPSSQTVR
jgi:hypothetical protein